MRSLRHPLKRRWTVLGTCLLAVACMPVLEGTDYQLAGKQVPATFLHTSDIHSRLIPYDYAPGYTDTSLGMIPEAGPFGGGTRMAAVLKREKANAVRALHVDSGDSFQGAPIFNLNEGEAEFRFLSIAGLDAAVVGNHEFDAGAANFTEQGRDNASFPLLAANYAWDDPRVSNSNQGASVSSPYTIINMRGLKVGIIGMANVSSLNSIVEGGNSLQVTPIEQNEAARAYIELIKPVVDLVTVVSHLGLTEDQDLVRGYEAFYEYGRVKEFIEREKNPWTIEGWFGPEGQDSSVVQVHIPGVTGLDILFGGHLHVVLSPPQTMVDPSGREVLLVHSGAFAKYVGKLDTVIDVPAEGEDAPEGAELVSHDYRIFPLDSLWCDDAMRDWYEVQFWEPGSFRARPEVREAMEACQMQEDREVTQLLHDYILDMDMQLGLATIFAYAPQDIKRRDDTGGDSALGNIAADSMRVRRRVEAEVSLTNTLGIRDELYAGVLTEEQMFNVFPFENTINIMYLSGTEMQEMLDFVASRSAERGCSSQAQISGMTFTMDCYQAYLNEERHACAPSNEGSDCPTRSVREGRAEWQCLEEPTGGGRCWAHPAIDIGVNGLPLDANGTYKIAVNDYIAKGGSGFSVLQRNTTRVETGISLRDSLVGYMKNFCTCSDMLAGETDENGVMIGSLGQPCGSRVGFGAEWVVEPGTIGFCEDARDYRDALGADAGGCSCLDVLLGDEAACGGEITSAQVSACSAVPAGPTLGRCSCRDALEGNTERCGHVTPQARAFCQNPLDLSIVIGREEGRIDRAVN